jgi:hypothetical protein
MYKQAYLRASEEADRLAEDPKKAARVAQREGIMSRISATVEDELSKPLSVDYISRMRKRVKEEGPKVEGGSVTGMATPDTGELPEGTIRPRGRTEVPRGEIQDKIFNGLVERGIPKHIAKGFLLNFSDESGFNPDIVERVPNKYGTRGKGLYQLTNDRRDAFEAKYGDDYSIENQLDWLVDVELNGTEKRAYKEMLETNTPGEAAAVIVKRFLRPAKKHAEERAKKYLSATGYAEN